MSEVTQLIESLGDGHEQSAESLLPLVYDELRQLAAARLAAEKSGLTLQATALVHEAYLRLVGDHGGPQWRGRAHFFGAAAEAMRRILIDEARRKNRLKRGGQWQRCDLETEAPVTGAPSVDLLMLDELFVELTQIAPAKAELVKLRFFAGFSLAEAADVLGISPATADRHWAYARAWLADRLRDEDDRSLGENRR